MLKKMFRKQKSPLCIIQIKKMALLCVEDCFFAYI